MKGLTEVSGPGGGDCSSCGGRISADVAELVLVTPTAGELRRFHLDCGDAAVAQAIAQNGAASFLWTVRPGHDQNPN